MPISPPRKGESEENFISRCIKAEKKASPERPDAQVSAICYTTWRKAKGIKEPNQKGDKVESELFRSDIARGIEDGKSGVDRENEIIRGFSVISKGEVKGHDQEVDDETIEQVIALGNDAKMGIKSRFGHPTMSNTALGTFLGRAKNFRRDSDIARADLYISGTAHKTPQGDLAEYVMSLAEADPDAFGASIVFKGKPDVRVNKDGTPMKNEETGEELLPLARIERLDGADIVDNPAANVGMFGDQFFSDGVKPSAEMAKFLDKFLLNPEAVSKTMDFLKRYSTIKEEEKEVKLANPDGGDQMHGAKEKPKEKAEVIPVGMKGWTIEDVLSAFESGVIDKAGAISKLMEIRGKEAKKGEKKNEEVKKMGEEKKVDDKKMEDERIVKLEKDIADGKAREKKASIESFLKEQKDAGKVLPAFEEKLKALFISLSDTSEISFMESGNETKLSQVEALKGVITSLIPMVKFGEEGKGGDKVLTEEEKQDKRAEEIRSEGVKLGKEISYAEALIQAAREAEKKK